MKTRWPYLFSILLASCLLAAPPALAQGAEESAEPIAKQSADDTADGEVEVGVNGSDGAAAGAPPAVLDSLGNDVSQSRESSGVIPPLQGNVTRTAPLGQPVPYPHYPQGYVMPNNFNAPNGFVPQGLTPPYQPNFAPPQAPPNGLQSGTAQADKNSDPPRGGLFGSALKSLLNGAINQNNAPPAERPWWIPGHAFTNDSMVAPYHAMDIFWWDKRPIPNKPQMVRLSTSVSRFWRGYVAEPCFVLVEPDPRAPGNFTFQSRQPNGPRGWLQALDKPDSSGFPQYRYWLDQ